jgi:hypothetical protein
MSNYSFVVLTSEYSSLQSLPSSRDIMNRFPIGKVLKNQVYGETKFINSYY